MAAPSAVHKPPDEPILKLSAPRTEANTGVEAKRTDRAVISAPAIPVMARFIVVPLMALGAECPHHCPRAQDCPPRLPVR